MNAPLASFVHVARRFTRSIRVDTDLADPAALEGYICSRSAGDAIYLMARHRDANGHGAFTWTGPYGSGKSSLAVAFAALLAGTDQQVDSFVKDIAAEDAAEIRRIFRPTPLPWSVVPIVGRRANVEDALANAVDAAVDGAPKRKRNESISAWILRVAASIPTAGLVLLIDEMGKFLEHAAIESGDIHAFQEIAEAASRSSGRLVVVGILHQAFDEYANRMSREARDEWLKVQGRFVDVSISLAGEEQIDLISRAIEAPAKPQIEDSRALIVAKAIRGGRGGPVEALADRLQACWPLHPVVSALLGPISRRRFGQSQRSIFGFLTSAEPFGFQEYLNETMDPNVLFAPEQLWDYLKSNLEPAILASPDGHRWSTAIDAIERCEAQGGSFGHVTLVKTIALLGLFKDRSGLQPTPEIIAQCYVYPEEPLDRALNQLVEWSVIVFRRHSDSYAIYAGSDFDIENAVSDARRTGISVDYRQLARQASLQPILAKRHYEKTGALRWFEVDLASLGEAEDRVRSYRPVPGAAGLFLLLICGEGESSAAAKKVCKLLSELTGDRLIVAGWTRDSYRLREMATELAALEYVRTNRPELEGDAIARREIDARISRLSADLEDRLSEAIDVVDWSLPSEAVSGTFSKLTGPAALSVLASTLADWRYPETPQLRNELVNRTKPSSSAAAAMRALIKAMVENVGQPRLGLTGYPPEAGLYYSLIEATDLYLPTEDGWRFVAPPENDAHRLSGMWRKAEAIVRASDSGASLGEVFDTWKAAPFGVRDGLLPILGMAFILTSYERAAVYLDGIFRPQLDSFLVDRLLQEPDAVRLRWIELSDLDVTLVAELSRRLSTIDEPITPSPLEVAKTIVRRVMGLPNWTTRTGTLSVSAAAVRGLARTSHDPNKLLFEDLPYAFQGTSNSEGTILAVEVDRALAELNGAYDSMLRDLAKTLFAELRFKEAKSGDYGPMQRRAVAVKGLTGNFRLDALATRLSSFQGKIDEIEGLASLAANKPPRDWVDRDVDAARIELAALAQQFLRAEGLGHLKGRVDGQVTMVVYLSDPDFPAPAAPEVILNVVERGQAQDLSLKLIDILSGGGIAANVAMGALAKAGLALAMQENTGTMEEQAHG